MSSGKVPVEGFSAGGSYTAPVLDSHAMSAFLHQARVGGARIGLCHGCFDLVHPGHMEHFEECRQYCDILVVSITADAFINKGPGRPVFDQGRRAAFLAALRPIDAVFIAHEPTALSVIDLIQPDLYFKGVDYSDHAADITGMIAQERFRVEKNGGSLFITDTAKSSSTQLIQTGKLLDLPKPVQDWIERMRKQTSLSEVLEYVEGRFGKLDVSVFGDLIIDEYVACTPVGTTSKAPAISAIFRETELMAGGSAAIARNMAEYARQVRLVCQRGELNWTFDSLMNESLASNIDVAWIRNEKGFTPQKIRFLSTGYPNTLNTASRARSEETPVKLFEYAYLNADKSDRQLLQHALDADASLARSQNLVWADFGHGFLGREAWCRARQEAEFIALNVQTNSTNFGFNLVNKYSGADFVCIDELEARLALHDRERPFEEIMQQLGGTLHCSDIAITRGKSGLTMLSAGSCEVVPALAQRIIDPVGAGDAVLSMMTLSRLAKAPPAVAGILAGAAGALACQIVGNRLPVQKSALVKFVTGLF
jgi:rfaE bifunctional protein nucleotidyltransferase chain/domain